MALEDLTASESNRIVKPLSFQDLSGSAKVPTSTTKLCAHCGTAFDRNFSRSETFCCQGCETIFGLIHRLGLTDFYKHRAAGDIPAVLKPLKGDWFKKTAGRDWKHIDFADVKNGLLCFYAEGLDCSACVWILERLELVDSRIQWSRIDLSQNLLKVQVNLSAIAAEADLNLLYQTLASKISELGFSLHFLNQESDQSRIETQTRTTELLRLGIVAALTANVMMMAFSLYGGATGDEALLFRWLMGILATPVLTWGAWPLLRVATVSLLQKRISLDLPIVAAVIAAFITSWWGLLSGLDTLYFDSSCMLVFLITASRVFLKRFRSQFEPRNDIIPLWLKEIYSSPQGQQVKGTDLKPGDEIFLEPGMTLPADATLIVGTSRWDMATITGESRPIEVRAGFEVLAGAHLCSDQRVALKIKNTPDKSRLLTLIADWRNGPRVRTEEVALFDRVGEIFTLITFSLAIYLTFAMPNLIGLTRALTVLIVSCPCIFGFAIPLSQALAMRRASESGLIVREPSFFSKLLKIKSVYLDKTGTLTTGQMSVERLNCFQPNERSQILQRVLLLEKGHKHPVAVTLENYCQTQIQTDADVASKPVLLAPSTLIPTGGVWGKFSDGTFALVPREDAKEITIELRKQKSHSAHIEVGQMFDSIHSDLVAEFILQDQLREGTARVLKALRDHLNQSSRNNSLSLIQILSGDQLGPVQATARKAGLSPDASFANLSPSKKLEKIAKDTRPALMIGDGVNDAEALKQAYVSVAVRGDFEQCLNAADSVLITADLEPIAESLKIAKSYRRSLLCSLAFSTSFNIISATLASIGLMSPLLAAIVMPISSLTVTFISWFGITRPSKKTETQIRSHVTDNSAPQLPAEGWT